MKSEEAIVSNVRTPGSAMTRQRILVGHVSEETYTDGSQAFNDAVISGLREVADVCLVVTNYWGRRRPGPLVEETVHDGLPAIVVRPRTELAFDLGEAAQPSEELEEGRYISQRIADFAMKLGVDIIHILQWGHLKGCLFEAALRAKIPFVHTPYEYWSICPQFFMLHYGRTPCSGPDDLGQKCWACISQQDGFPTLLGQKPPRSAPKRSFRKLLPRWIKRPLSRLMGSKLMMRVFGPGWAPRFGWAYAGQWKIILRQHALRKYLGHAARILPMTAIWGRNLAKHLRIPTEKFCVCPPGIFEQADKLPEGSRFQHPLQFGHPHRVSREGGTLFVLEAWRKAGITPSHGVLNIYGAKGDRARVENSIFSDLIKSGSVKVHEGRIADRLDEIFAPLAAVISGYQWEIGACGNGHAIARGIPNIASRWDSEDSEMESPLREGRNALLYRRWDSDSLAEVLRICAADPTVLQKLFETCELPPGFTHQDFIRRYLRVYQAVLTDAQTHPEID